MPPIENYAHIVIPIAIIFIIIGAVATSFVLCMFNKKFSASVYKDLAKMRKPNDNS